MGADGPICNHMARLELRIGASPQGEEAPLQPICAPSNSPRNHGDYGRAKPGVPSRFFPSGRRGSSSAPVFIRKSRPRNSRINHGNRKILVQDSPPSRLPEE